MDRRSLVEAARSGDRAAFDALARSTVARLDAAARLILRDDEAARDAVQDAYVRAWRDLRGLRDPDRFDAWLHRLLVNACYDEARRQRRQMHMELTDAVHPTAPDAFAAGQDRDALERAFRTLSADQRAVIVLHYYLDLPLTEAAPALEVPVGTAKSRLHRALQTLRLTLERDDFLDPRPTGGQNG
jgi:RNA polymerase sigma-70 factor (ECF subfamily)